jgi:hypothetical protein
LNNSIHFVLIASISAFCVQAGAVNEITNAITSAMLRMIISNPMYDSNAGMAFALTRSGCVECRIPGRVWRNSNSGELPSATLTNRGNAAP